MTSWLNETAFVQNLAQDMLTPRRNFYQEDYITVEYKTIESCNFNFHNFYVNNKFGQRIKATVFKVAEKMEEEYQYCIVYLHGFGSHRLQGATLLTALGPEFGLCCFDFSGSGKSQGTMTTYGIKQYLDIECIIKTLKKQFKFKKFILWGRSMGATASVLYTSSPQMPKQDILFQVLDSPFCTFESIAKHHANVSYKLPQLFVNFGINIVKQHFQSHQYNPFKIDLTKTAKQCEIPALFVYSEQDAIIPPANTTEIIENFNPNILYERLLIPQNHNSFRGKETLGKILQIVKKYILQNKVKQKIKYRRGILQVLSNPCSPKQTQIFKIGISNASSNQNPNLQTSINQKHTNHSTYSLFGHKNHFPSTNQKIKIMKLSGASNSPLKKKQLIKNTNPEEISFIDSRNNLMNCFGKCSKPDNSH